ncbi:unnamed protein product [Cuscuta europaea]|uniref:Two-component response regulator-like APRR1 n=1 Tax=Cuscuta europaea TaxID=41803 RepID=A0A9P1EBQ7_CUSEU|nr:unnamed protein product [Cuscuta europaea]
MENKETMKTGDGFIDRSKVRILLCDNDSKSSGEVFTLLCKCSYQVTCVRSPRQVIDALNAAAPDIDIILCEVDLPMSKGMKLMKYIMRDKELRRIPVIMMSSQDEVSVVVKCLRLGAADYLVKPLRTNELLNLWTHMWRRRRMLGLVEKNMINYDFDLVISDPSDASTNSTALFSDDTDEKSCKSNNPVTSQYSQQEDEANATTSAAYRETAVLGSFECLPVSSHQKTGKFCSIPKKSELKIGGPSAFFTYVKSNPNQCAVPENTSHQHHHPSMDKNLNSALGGNVEETKQQTVAVDYYSQGDDYPRSSNSIPVSLSMETDDFSKTVHMHQPYDSQNEMLGLHTHTACPQPYYIPGMMNHVVMPGMGPYTYYQVNMCLQQWPSPSSYGSSLTVEGGKVGKIMNRREAALMKFREKKKARCFDKKIRYVNRKQLADRRPRVRGQFVRKPNGVLVDLNGHPPPSGDDDDDDEEEDEDGDDEIIEE